MTNSCKGTTNFGLPLDVLNAIYKATQQERKINRENKLNTKRGPKRLPPERINHAVLIADSDHELNELTRAFHAALGKKCRGNKRFGRKHIYAELIQNFYALKNLGIKLPRNKYLSRKATLNGLARTLVDCSITTYDEQVIMSPNAHGVKARQEIACNHARLFSRVADAVEGKL